jgi:TolB-like protein/tetratricopeptide (TPR) repeat protein
MPERNLDQRLVAILAADVAGYSRLMEANERATVNALDASRAVFRDHVAAHRGRIVDTAGDSILAVFPSAIGAVIAALEIQDELGRRNASVLEEQQMHFRLGVNLGDVIEKDDGSVYGSGINVAARLESLAAPGSIMISEDVHRQVMGKVNRNFENAGAHAVKNIANPVRAFRVVTETAPGASPSADKPLTLPDKPSIAVLPFDNLSGDPDQEYFADGIAEDLITALSRIRWMFVTARNSSFAYKGQSPDVRHVGKELGVRYVLEGSVRKSGKRVRISAQLIDASTGNHVWAERYDRELVDLFDLQDEITETLVAALQTEVGEFERERAMRKSPANLEAWDHYQRGMWHMYRFTAIENAEAQRYFRQAIELDPRFGSAYSGLAYACFLDVAMGYTASPDDSRAEALEAAKMALGLDRKDAMAHCALGRVYGNLGMADFDAAIVELRTAIRINPSFALAHFGLGHALTYAGRPDEALTQFDNAIRLSPHDPYLWLFQSMRGFALLLMKEHDQALTWLQASSRHGNVGFWAYAFLSSCLGHLGRRREADDALQQLLKIKPDFSFFQNTPLKNPEHSRQYATGLRKAGLEIPDES